MVGSLDPMSADKPTGEDKRQTNERYLKVPRKPHDGREDARQNMRVFVRVQMRRPDSRRKNLLNLSVQLTIDVHLSSCQVNDQPERGFRQLFPGDQRISLHQDQMATDIESGSLLCQQHGVFKGVAVRH